ncbi:Lhr family ATP-dependent helicase, partial [Mycobacterium tuberculosis]|uniref:Lhr family ATP-dependent helicase n=1 Tax=Mycobacterium tuberculosis TaxID=1773 RepID=UPI003F7A8B77|nr:ATP-dependent helicase [Mycobacterium tuberculosis]
YARTHTPFTTAEVAARFGLGLRVTSDVLGRLAADGRLGRGDFVAATPGPSGGVAGAEQWCDADVLRILRRRSLAALRAQVEPVSTAAYGRFLPAWHHVGAAESPRAPGHSGLDGLMSVIDQLAGVRIPASAIEPLVLVPRGRDYPP